MERDHRHHKDKKHKKRSRSRSPKKVKKHKSKNFLSQSTERDEKQKKSSEKDYYHKQYISLPEDIPSQSEAPDKKEEINFEATGILAKFSNTYNGVTVKFTEPLDAKIPDRVWRIYPFKGEQTFNVVQLRNQSAFLFGSEIRIADHFLENPTCSAQHAVVQFREKKFENDLGELTSVIKPYIMDLESTNGTLLNNEKIEPSKYYELLDKDIIKFGHSQREYVIMREID